MTGFAAVVARELQEWKRVFAAAVAAGFLVFLAPLLPATRGHHALQTINMTAGFLAFAFGIGIALLAGSSFIARDLHERRMTFYFCKPLSTASIWGGKLTAAVFLAFFSAVLTLVPATLIGGGLLSLSHETHFGSFALAALGIWIIVAVIWGHSAGIGFRARGAHRLDLLGVLAVLGLFGVIVFQLVQSGAFRLAGLLVAVFLVVAWLGGLVGGLVGLIQGRVDLREVNKFDNITQWLVMGVLLVAFIGYSMWVRAVDPEDLRSPSITAAPANGAWMTVSGRSVGRLDYQPALLVNLQTRKFVRIEKVVANSIAFSSDGRRAIWLEATGLDLVPRQARLVVATLLRKPAIEKTAIFVKPHAASTLSVEGTRLATLSDGLLTVTDLDTERAIASARIPDSEQQHLNRHRHLRFITSDVVRVFALSTTNTLKIYEFDISRRHLGQTGTVTLTDGFSYRISPHLDYLAVQRYQVAPTVQEFSLHDARTGQRIATLPPAAGHRAGMFSSLSNRRFALLTSRDGQARLDIFSLSAQHQKTIDLGPAGWVTLGGEVGPGKLIVSTSIRKVPSLARAVTVSTVDVESGKIVKVAEGLVPLAHRWSYTEMPGTDTIWTKIFEAEDATLVYFDPLTGERRVIAGRPNPLRAGWIRKGAES